MGTEKKKWVIEQDKLKEKMQKSKSYKDFNRELDKLRETNIFMYINQSWGRGDNFYNLFWWDIKVNSNCFKEEFKKYSDILLIPHRISLSEIAKTGIITKDKDNNIWLVKKERFKKTTEYPHIDITTGNFHIENDFTEWLNCPRIEQVALVTSEDNDHLGPRYEFAKGKQELTFNGMDSSDFIVLQGDDITSARSISKISIPKKCYYPELEDAESKNESIQDMINNLLANVVENKARDSQNFT